MLIARVASSPESMLILIIQITPGFPTMVTLSTPQPRLDTFSRSPSIQLDRPPRGRTSTAPAEPPSRTFPQRQLSQLLTAISTLQMTLGCCDCLTAHPIGKWPAQACQ